jgi:hypothetical protein
MTVAKKIKKLTAAEKQWIAKLEAVLAECPSKRIGSFTIGDPQIVLYDSSMDAEIGKLMDSRDSYDFCQAVEEVGATLCVVDFPFPVHSTAG